MSNETKQDVFDDALAYAPVGREYDPVNDDEAGDLRSCYLRVTPPPCQMICR